MCIVQIQPRKHLLDHADNKARQHELDHTDHTVHIDQVCYMSSSIQNNELPDPYDLSIITSPLLGPQFVFAFFPHLVFRPFFSVSLSQP